MKLSIIKATAAALLAALGVSGSAAGDVGPPHEPAEHTETLRVFMATRRPDGTLVYPPALFTYQVTPWTCAIGSPEQFYVGDGNLGRGYTHIHIRWCEQGERP